MTRSARLVPLSMLLAALGGCTLTGAGTSESATPSLIPEPVPRVASPPESPRLAALRARFPNAQSLIGLSAAETEDAFGAPAFKRKDPPAEIWQYLSDSCRLDLFLYRKGDAVTITHLDARDAKKPGASAPADACLNSVLARRARA